MISAKSEEKMLDTSTDKLPVIADTKAIVPRSSPLVARGLDLIKTIEHPIDRQSHESEVIHRFIGHSDQVHCIAVSIDGKLILSGSSDKTARLWDLSSGKEVVRLEGHTDSILSVALSLDGRYAATGGRDNTIKIWSLIEKRELRSFILSGSVSEISWFNADRICFTLRNTQSITSNDTRCGTLTAQIHNAHITTEGRRLNNDDETVRSLSETSKSLTIGFLDIRNGSLEHSILQYFQGDNLENIDMIALSSDSYLALTHSVYNPTIRVWHTQTSAMLFESKVDLLTLFRARVSPQKSFLILAGTNNYRDSEILLWDLKQNCEFFRFTIPKQTDETYPYKTVWDLSISPDSRLALIAMCEQTYGFWGEPDPLIHLWDLRAGQHLTTMKGHSDLFMCVSFLPDGLHAVSGSWDHTILLYRLPQSRLY